MRIFNMLAAGAGTAANSAKSGRPDQWYGTLYPEEIALAKTVFADTLPYNDIFISKVSLGGGAPVTIATNPVKSKAQFLILWEQAWNLNVATQGNDMKTTLIHELTHVWQGTYGNYVMGYMAESVWSQLREGVRDIFKDGPEKGIERVRRMVKEGMSKWDEHRSHAYKFTMKDVGKNWNTFNVEQQASIIESWYSFEPTRFIDGSAVPAGYRSPKDPRYPYIKDNIRAKDANAAYSGVANQPGYSAEIAEIQAKLYVLGYFTDDKYVDGYMGDITRNAVREFQRRNGLGVDGNIGTPNSQTRRKLGQPLDKLIRK